jgi:tetratricopeptide (TPR) repeat protein
LAAIAADPCGQSARARADLLCGLGEISMDEGRPDLALVPFEQSLRAYRVITPGPSADVSLLLNNLGVVHEKLSRLDESERALLEAMEIDRRLGSGPDALARTLNNLAVTYQAQGRITEAQVAFDEAASLGGLPADLEDLLQQQRAFHRMNQGEFASALVDMHLQLAQADPGSLNEAYLAGDLAQAYFELQRMPEAERLHRRAIDLRRRLQPGSMPLAIALSNLAATLTAVDRRAEADVCLREAIGLAERIAPHSVELAAMRGTLLFGLLDQGRYREVTVSAQRAIADAPAATRQLTGVYLAAALAHDYLDEPARARRTLERARDACERISPTLSELTPVLMMLGWHCLHHDDLEAAADAFDHAIRVAESRRPGAADEPGLELRFGTAEPAYHGRIVVAWRRQELGDAGAEAEVAFHAAESFRARTLAELLNQVDDPRPAAEPAAGLLAELGDVRVRLGAAYRDDAREHLRDALEQRAEHLRARLRALAPEVADRETPGPCRVDEVQRRLGAGTVLAVYEVTDDGVFLFTISPTTFGFTLVEASSRDIAAAVAEVLAACRNPGSPSPDAALRRLGSWLLKPLGDLADRLVISANGVLSYLPFPALLLDGAALTDRCAVSSVPSATTLARYGERPRTRRPTRDFAGFGLSRVPGAVPLPAVERELREVAALFPGGLVLLNEQVTAEAVRDGATTARFVHLATHGSIDDERPLYSGFPLNDDRFLHAYELATFTLSAELVVCSACDTAVGASRPGEGVVGLAYSLFSAGARAVLVSRWPVNDRVTRRMMVRLYEDLARGVPAASAVRTATSHVRRRHPHPREWAAFDLITIGP